LIPLNALMLRLALIGVCFFCCCAHAFQSQDLVNAARSQIGKTLIYDPSYVKLDYPNGDIDIGRGVCTDVVIRAYRALGLDLQKLVHEDMRDHWRLYPKLWRLKAPDRNIDHRRVPNLATYFKRFGQSFKITNDASNYLAGDVVTWRLASGVPHIGVVSNNIGAKGTPKVIHNIGLGTQEDDVLFEFVLTGHYRWLPKDL
jgi:uncharacterized protein